MPMLTPTLTTTLSHAQQVLTVEIEALQALSQRLDASFEQAVTAMAACTGRVVVIGMGKSGLVGQKIAATLSSTGTPACFLHPAEACHGDLGMVLPQDVAILISYSGETPEVLALLPALLQQNIPCIALTGNTASTLAQKATLTLNIQVPQEACHYDLAPTASTTVTMALGDALALCLMQHKGFGPDDFARYHPAGALGKRLLLRVQDVMRTGEALPVLGASQLFWEAILEISAKQLGMGLVLDASEKLLGVLTDGDIRRALMTQPDQTQTLRVDTVMTPSPKTIAQEAMAAEAKAMMTQHQITVLPVLDETKTVVGIIHLHDILRAGL